MKKFLERYPWVQQAGCGVLICALLLSICLPLMGMRSAEPENPILDAAPQEITVLQTGQAPGHADALLQYTFYKMSVLNRKIYN